MAFETLTNNCLEAVQGHLAVKSPFDKKYGAYVLMEVERPSSPDAQSVLDAWLGSLFENNLVLDGTIAQSPREARDLWSLREGISESIYQVGFLHKNDIALPIAALESFIKEMYAMFTKRHSEFEIYLFGHIGDGNLHVNTMMPKGMERDVFLKACHEADLDLFALVQKYQGSISAEHGIGLLKKEWLKYSRSGPEMAILRSLKKGLDPQNLLNPGKIFD